jgi:hypothetical protein
MRVIECSMSRRRIVQEAGVDRFTVRRLTEVERAFRRGGRVSRSPTRKKGGDKADAQSHSNSLWTVEPPSYRKILEILASETRLARLALCEIIVATPHRTCSASDMSWYTPRIGMLF